MATRMTAPQRIETARRIQIAMATSYSALGAWCLLHPSSIFQLGFTSAYAPLCNVTTSIFCRCFGAQAMTCGLVLGTSNMTSKSFYIFGAAMIPYIVGFNFCFAPWRLAPGRGYFTNLIWLDFVGNVFFLGGSLVAGWLLGGVEEQEKEKELKKGGKKE
ncbi:hypothetical protein V8F20_011830 [Naviculisporaceae sp. PSN 640]